jgi:hypothetical protein
MFVERIRYALESHSISCAELDEEWNKLLSRRNARMARVLALKEAATAAATGDWLALPPSETNGGSVYLMPTGTRTTAAPRPNAYLPLGKEASMPVARPYGATAPFLPGTVAVAGASGAPIGGMRHFRKPDPKPLEI